VDVCELKKTDVILGIPWLTTYNLEIDWEIVKVRMTRYLLLCECTPKKKVIKRRKIIVENKRDL